MTPALDRVLKMYERGALALIHLVVETVLETTEPPAAWAARVPAEATDWIRTLAARPADHPWTVAELESLNHRSPPPDDETLLTMWRTGLTRWRAYFDAEG